MHPYVMALNAAQQRETDPRYIALREMKAINPHKQFSSQVTLLSRQPRLTEPAREVAVYVGSGPDVVPYVFFPQFDWVCVTAEGTGYWPRGCVGYEFGDSGIFAGYMTGIMQCGTVVASTHDWTSGRGNALWMFKGQRFPRYLSAECRRMMQYAEVIFMKGYQPDVSFLPALCPRLRKCIRTELVEDPRGLETVDVPCYDFDRVIAYDKVSIVLNVDARDEGFHDFMDLVVKHWPHDLNIEGVSPQAAPILSTSHSSHHNGVEAGCPTSTAVRPALASQPALREAANKFDQQWRKTFDQLRIWLQQHDGQYPLVPGRASTSAPSESGFSTAVTQAHLKLNVWSCYAHCLVGTGAAQAGRPSALSCWVGLHPVHGVYPKAYTPILQNMPQMCRRSVWENGLTTKCRRWQGQRGAS